MTEKEKQAMMAEIIGVVEKHVAMSEKNEEENMVDENNPYSTNRYGRSFGISDKEMEEWKKQYRMMRCDTKTILEQVMRNPINTSNLQSSFDISRQMNLI